MYKRLDRSHANILGYEVEGKITEEEYEQLTTEVRAAIGTHGSVRLLVRARGFPTAEIKAVDEQLSFARDHLSDIERYAVVTDHTGLELVTKASEKLVNVDIRQFDLEDEEAAWAWLEAPS